MYHKYIIIESMTLETPILFPNWLGHDFMVDSIHSRYPGVKIVSAGEFDWVSNGDGNIRIMAFGESISCRIKSRPEDAEIISKFLNRRLPDG